MQNIALFLSYKTRAARTMISPARARPVTSPAPVHKKAVFCGQNRLYQPSVHKKAVFCGQNRLSQPSIHKKAVFCGQNRLSQPSVHKKAVVCGQIGFFSPPDPKRAGFLGRIPALSLYWPEIASRQVELAILAGDKLCFCFWTGDIFFGSASSASPTPLLVPARKNNSLSTQKPTFTDCCHPL